MGRFSAGDPLRAIACLGVFIFHAGSAALVASGFGELLSPNPDSRTMFGSVIGVPLSSVGTGAAVFFALSGYLVARPFVRAFIDGTRPPSITRYLRNRAFRIVPAFWIALTLVIVIWGLNGTSLLRVLETYAFSANWATSSFAPHLGQAWTLGVEVRFYLWVAVLGIACVMLRRPLSAHRWARAAVLIAGFFAVGIVSLVAYRDTPAAGATNLPACLCDFAPGLMLAAIEPLVATRVRDSRATRWIAAAILGSGFVAFCTFSSLARPFSDLSGLGRYASGRLYVGLADGALLAGPLLYQWSTGGCWRILDNAVLRWLGGRSYSFYLIHFAVLAEGTALLTRIGGYKVEFLVLTLAALATTAVLAEVGYRTVEMPCRRLGRRLGARSVAPSTQTPRHVPDAIAIPDPIRAGDLA